MKIGFIQGLKSLSSNASLTFKNIRVVGKRTTLYSDPKKRANRVDIGGPKRRLKPIEVFANFIRENMPKFEEKIELNILNRQFENIQNEDVKRELIQSYYRRRVRLESLLYERLRSAVPAEDNIIGQQEKERKNVWTNVPMRYQNQKDIGYYNSFPLSDVDKFFKDGIYGEFLKEDIMRT